NVTFQQADAQVHPFPPESLDVAISRAGTMFFGDPAAAFGNIAGAIRHGGRLVMLVWQSPEANEWIREVTGALSAGRDFAGPPMGSPGPFALANPDRVNNILTGAGFSHVDVEPLCEQMWFGSDTDDACRFILGLMGWMLAGL